MVMEEADEGSEEEESPGSRRGRHTAAAPAAGTRSSFGKRKHVRETCRAFRRRVKEHRSRFYILRRCVSILICWHRHHLSDHNP
ncbi:hypothetical protein CDL15_Pgr022720 [Punica granatum]|uniref:DVL-like protein n=1 Tax=Punica granatum TaxID=22663 RepID=A0A218XRH4_PUNGR|nr:hypothetical protein CDL15_Pgr022720 [Punica granatum]PKI74572.1 hypothetical protein CRG98_004899 [Punica granatum]